MFIMIRTKRIESVKPSVGPVLVTTHRAEEMLFTVSEYDKSCLLPTFDSFINLKKTLAVST